MTDTVISTFTNLFEPRIKSFVSNKEKPTLGYFATEYYEDIASASKEFPEWKTLLPNIFKKEVESIGKRYLKGNWIKFREKLERQTPVENSGNHMFPSNSPKLSKNQLDQYKKEYQSLSEKWRVGNKMIEDIMYQIGSVMTHEHVIHSWVFNPLDPIYADKFNEAEMEVLLKRIDLPNNAPMDEFLDSFKNCTTMEQIKSKLNEFVFDWNTQFDLWWFKRTLEEILLLYFLGTIEKLSGKGSEADLVSRVWSLFDPLYERYNFFCTRPERPTIATESVTNDYTVSGGTRSLKYACPLPDFIAEADGYEYACHEYGVSDDKDMNLKEAKEGCIKLPKEMKNLLGRLLGRLNGDEEEKKKEVCVVGFLCSKLRMNMMVMDQPGGSICRLTNMEEVQIPIRLEEAWTELLPVLETAWISKEIMAGTAQLFKKNKRRKAMQMKGKSKELPQNVNNMNQYQRRTKK